MSVVKLCILLVAISRSLAEQFTLDPCSSYLLFPSGVGKPELLGLESRSIKSMLDDDDTWRDSVR